MKRFLDNTEVLTNTPVKKLVSLKEKRMNQIKGKRSVCSVCGQECKTSAGLKGHMTKKHGKEKTNTNVDTESRKRTAKDEVIQVVEDLLQEIIQISDDEVELEESIVIGNEEKVNLYEDAMNRDKAEVVKPKHATLNETCGNLKSYQNKCEYCEYVAVASKRYGALQLLKRHKESCSGINLKKSSLTKNCDQCDFEMNDYLLMRRHMRDSHNVVTASTSPPPKKTKRAQEKSNDDGEPMETEDDNIKDISIGMEDMEIEIDITQERSRLMDEKILSKEQLNEKKEKKLEDKFKEVKEDKRMKEEKKRSQLAKNNKKRKQGVKDLRKIMNKKSRKVVNTTKNGRIPVQNIRNIPMNCKHLVREEDVLYVVPGDGCCGPNCAAALLFGDEVFGPKLRRKMNLFMAKHWNTRYRLISQCSEGHPFVRKLKDGEVSFTDPKELLEYLMNSEEAAYMWSDSEDLAIISDMYQIRIKVITCLGENDTSPTVNWIYPEPNLKSFAELKNVELDDMVLFHQNDCHFNLVVSNQSDLALLGSLSYRFNVGPLLSDGEIPDTELEEEADTEVNETTDDDHKGCKAELKKFKEIKSKIEKEYLKCEKELRNKTEEYEKLKIEVNDLKQILKLKDELEQSGLNESMQESTNKDNNDKENTKKGEKSNEKKASYANKTKVQFSCEICAFQCASKIQLNNHVTFKHSTQKRQEEEFNCCECDFQLNS